MTGRAVVVRIGTTEFGINAVSVAAPDVIEMNVEDAVSAIPLYFRVLTSAHVKTTTMVDPVGDVTVPLVSENPLALFIADCSVMLLNWMEPLRIGFVKYSVSDGAFKLKSKLDRIGFVESAVYVATAITPGLRMFPLMSAMVVVASTLRNVVTLDTASDIILLIAAISLDASEIETVFNAMDETLTLVSSTASVGAEMAFWIVSPNTANVFASIVSENVNVSTPEFIFRLKADIRGLVVSFTNRLAGFAFELGTAATGMLMVSVIVADVRLRYVLARAVARLGSALIAFPSALEICNTSIGELVVLVRADTELIGNVYEFPLLFAIFIVDCSVNPLTENVLDLTVSENVSDNCNVFMFSTNDSSVGAPEFKITLTAGIPRANTIDGFAA